MMAVTVIFWLLLGVIFYSYIGYALLLLGFRRTELQQETNTALPEITLIIASYNEAAVLGAKLENALALDYPTNSYKVIVITDGSDDASESIIKQYPSVLHLHFSERRGKTAAINRAMGFVSTPIVVFSDANTLLNKECLLRLASHFSNTGIGAVAGEKKVSANSGMGSAEGWYWQYESFLKKLDASFYTVVGAAGELFAMRTALFSPLPEDTILDDFALSMQVCLQGYRIGYEPLAYATEAPSASLGIEKNRKMRIATGAFQTLKRLSFSKISQNGKLAFQFISRRWLRWVICPAGLMVLFLLNAMLALASIAFYKIFFTIHVLFYLLAAVGWLQIRRNKAAVLTTVPFYFLFMNYCMLAGLLRFWQGKGTVLWTKAERTASL